MGTSYDKHFKHLICLGYWRTKQWKSLVWENEAKANKFGGTKACEAEEVNVDQPISTSVIQC